jgi:hypothetical protein
VWNWAESSSTDFVVEIKRLTNTLVSTGTVVTSTNHRDELPVLAGCEFSHIRKNGRLAFKPERLGSGFVDADI